MPGCRPVRPRRRGQWRIPACSVSQARSGAQPAFRCAHPGRSRSFSGTRATQPAAPAQSFSLPAEKHLGRPGPAGCPPALLRLRAFRRRNTPQPRPRRRGPARRKARHEPHQLRRDHHLRVSRLRRYHHAGGLGLRGRLRPDLPRVRRGSVRALPAVVERRSSPPSRGGAPRIPPRRAQSESSLTYMPSITGDLVWRAPRRAAA